jgi:hypothetical protein
MKDAIITIVHSGEDSSNKEGYTWTEVWRVEFEGEMTITLADGLKISGVLNTERLIASP